MMLHTFTITIRTTKTAAEVEAQLETWQDVIMVEHDFSAPELGDYVTPIKPGQKFSPSECAMTRNADKALKEVRESGMFTDEDGVTWERDTSEDDPEPIEPTVVLERNAGDADSTRLGWVR